jgi:hypothetical protein
MSESLPEPRPATYHLACWQLTVIAIDFLLALASRDKAAILFTVLALACLNWFPVARRRWGVKDAALLTLVMTASSLAALWAGARALAH